MGKIQFLLVFIVLMAVNATPAKADYFVYEGIAYSTLTDSTCAVTYNYDISGGVIIPERVLGDQKVYSVTEIGESAFRGCPSLTSVEIPNSVTEIGGGAFSYCSSLTSVEIPNSVTEIGGGAFSGCTSLTSVEIPNGVTTIGMYAFLNCSSLASIEIPNSVTIIGGYALDGCTSLSSIDIPNSVEFIGYGAFYNCSSLKNLTIGNSVEIIREATFEGCSGLTSVDIPNSVTTIGYSAFRGCSELMYLTIGNSVEEIGEYAFYGCPNLKSVTSLSILPPAAYRSTFSPNSYAATLNIPKGTYDFYKHAECWQWFILTAEYTNNSIPEIPADADGDITIHNIGGHRLTNPQRGLNIINDGKKVLKR